MPQPSAYVQSNELVYADYLRLVLQCSDGVRVLCQISCYGDPNIVLLELDRPIPTLLTILNPPITTRASFRKSHVDLSVAFSFN